MSLQIVFWAKLCQLLIQPQYVPSGTSYANHLHRNAHLCEHTSINMQCSRVNVAGHFSSINWEVKSRNILIYCFTRTHITFCFMLLIITWLFAWVTMVIQLDAAKKGQTGITDINSAIFDGESLCSVCLAEITENETRAETATDVCIIISLNLQNDPRKTFTCCVMIVSYDSISTHNVYSGLVFLEHLRPLYRTCFIHTSTFHI